jgi:hypothetical protein
MAIANEKIKNRELLAEMYADDYFPDFLVDIIKADLVDLCEQIEIEQPKDEGSLLKQTNARCD